MMNALVAQIWGFMSVVGQFTIKGFRQRANPLTIVEQLRGWVLLFLQELELRVEKESAFFWQISECPPHCEDESPRNSRLLCLAPAKEMIASRCSCRSPVGPGALMGASLTCGTHAIPVLLRPCSPPLRSALLCTCHLSRQHAPLQHIRQWWDAFRAPRNQSSVCGCTTLVFSCEEVLDVAAPILFQQAHQCRPPPRAVADVLIPRF